ncbi:MAG: VTT domain-containing protein [Acidobacteriota bacterium]
MAEARRRRLLLLRLGLVALLLASGFLLLRFTPLGELLERDRVIELVEQIRDYWWSPLALIGAYAVFGPLALPASPLVIAGALVFGFTRGAILNIGGLMVGAMTSYWVGHALGREAVVQLAGPRLKRAEAVFQRQSFWPLVQTRFLPIPFSVVGYGAALAGVPAMRYAVTSFLGLLPATLVHTYFIPALIYAALDGEKPIGLTAAYGACIVGLNALVAWPQIQRTLRRRARYRELVAVRRARQERRDAR